MKRNDRREAGYTMIEILAVLTLLAVLIMLVTPNVINSITKGKISATKAQIAAIDGVLTNYYMDNGMYPTTEQGLKALLEKPSIPPTPDNWAGPYMKGNKLPQDGWNHDFRYVCPGVHNTDSYDLFSNGADNVEGGTGPNADIGNW